MGEQPSIVASVGPVHSTSTDQMEAPKRGDGVIEPMTAKSKKFTFWSTLGIAISCSGAWEGWMASVAQGLVAGSAVGLLWGWIFVSIGIMCMACSLSELVSMWPSSGGQYVWVAELAPKSLRSVLSYYTAWLSITGLWLGAISAGMGVAVQVQAYVFITHPSYNLERWHAFLINVAVIVIWVVINIYWTRGIHLLNKLVIVIHLAGFLVIVITLAVTTHPKHDAKFVFTDFENSTGWDSNGVAWFIGLLPSLYAFFSLDSASHYSEEIPRANVAVPRAMVIQAVGNSLMTFPFIIVTLYCLGNPLDILNSPIGFTSPYTQIVLNSTGSPAAAIILNSLSTSVAFIGGLDLWGGAARAMWSLARDGGLPGPFARLHPKYDVPHYAILALLPPALIIVMIYIFNTTAFYGIMAGVLVAFQMSYVIPIALHLFYARRKKNFVYGPWQMKKFGWVLDSVSLGFGLLMVVFMSFPTYQPVTAATMNYSVAIIGSVTVLSLLLYLFYGRKRYNGPVLVLDAANSVVARDDIAIAEGNVQEGVVKELEKWQT